MLPWQTFLHCPSCGRRTGQPGSNPFRCRLCGFCYFFNPAVGVAAILLNDSGQMLVLERARAPHQGMLGIPGGFLDVGESIEDGLRREIREEVNLSVTSLDYLCTIPNEYAYEGIRYQLIDVFFLATVACWDNLRCQPREITRHAFVDLADFDLERLAFPSNRTAVRQFCGR